MLGRSTRAACALIFALTVIVVGAPPSGAHHTAPGAKSFTTLEAPFTQELIGTAPVFVGGIGFAPDGDVWFTPCGSGGDPLWRFDMQAEAPEQGGSPLHPASSTDSDSGCGLTNHPNGSLYSNTSSGVTRLDGSTGAAIGGPFGPSGNVLGIAVDPQTGNVVYAAGDGSVAFVNADLTASGSYSTTDFCDIDGLYFDPTGSFLFLAERCSDSIVILDRSGATINTVPVGAPLDGIAFKALAPRFVITNNTDGTMSKIVFPGDDFTQPATVTQFASGGFYGDLTQVGPDGCLYVSQSTGTRFADDSTSGNGSIVKICGGFAPPPGVGEESAAQGNCADGIDNDGDGNTDATDPDCPSTSATDPSSTSATAGVVTAAASVQPKFTG